MSIRIAILSCSMAAVAAPCGCVPDEEPDPCADYCDAAGECAGLSHQPFSHSECNRKCDEAMERHVSVNCGPRFADYLECKTDLYCGDWNIDSQYCAAEIDYVDLCLAGNS
jgi:hypothetical protein